MLPPLRYCLDLLAASGTFCVFKKLHLSAARVVTLYHQASAAAVTAYIYEGVTAAEGAYDVKFPAAPGTDHLILSDGTPAGGADISEGASAAAGGAISGIPVDQCFTVDTWLLIRCHFLTPLFRLSCAAFTAEPGSRLKRRTAGYAGGCADFRAAFLAEFRSFRIVMTTARTSECCRCGFFRLSFGVFFCFRRCLLCLCRIQRFLCCLQICLH